MFNFSRIFGSQFYDKFKQLERPITVVRKGNTIKHIRGVISKRTLMLPPSPDMPIKDGDLIIDNFNNKFIVRNIENEGTTKTTWQLKLERYADFKYKRRVKKQVITNKINNNGNMNQNIGNGNKISNQADHYSLTDITKYVPKMKNLSDQQKALKLEQELKQLKDNKKPQKKGFLNHFNDLLGKYPHLAKITASLLLKWAIAII